MRTAFSDSTSSVWVFNSINRRKKITHTRRPTYVCNVRWCQPLMRKHFREMFARPVKWLPFIMNESICLPLLFTHTYGNRENEHRTTNCVRTDSTQLTGCAALSLYDKNSSITRCRLPLCGSRHNAHLHEEQMRHLAGTASYRWDKFCAEDFFRACFISFLTLSSIPHSKESPFCNENNALTKCEPVCADETLLSSLGIHESLWAWTIPTKLENFLADSEKIWTPVLHLQLLALFKPILCRNWYRESHANYIKKRYWKYHFLKKYVLLNKHV